ncbi:hypothetical protein QQF64_023142 [Cirrhinus molitorella]|uniref:Uncharacterized protein n=1 Tax=Cirrhinus molitorella TaxID=172907 RepID=A0ABR3L6V2_9TELE
MFSGCGRGFMRPCSESSCSGRPSNNLPPCAFFPFADVRRNDAMESPPYRPFSKSRSLLQTFHCLLRFLRQCFRIVTQEQLLIALNVNQERRKSVPFGL